MDVPEIKPVELTPEEADLRYQMEAEFSGTAPYSGSTAVALTKSLLSRDAIPESRVRIFTDPYPGGRGKSHKKVFESHGHRGDAIFKQPHFVAYLRYFIDGPSLPRDTIEGFRKILIEDLGTTGMIMDALQKFARAEVRKLRLERGKAQEEFWRLAKEVGYSGAEAVRNAAGNAG